jgi:hypothetical protein
MNTQHEIHPTPPQMGQYQNPSPNQLGNPVNRNILLTSEEEILLQIRGRQYDVPPEYNSTTSEASPATTRQPLIIPTLTLNQTLVYPVCRLQRNIHNPHARETHNYNLVDDLTQYHISMSILEVLQTYPTWWKSLLFSLGKVNPVDTRLITSDLDSGEPRIPSLVSF